MRSMVLLGSLLLALLTSGQDTLRLMHYNLLNYGNNYGDCNNSNNSVADKNEYLKVLVDYIKPDILSVNEIDDQASYHENLLNNVLNIDGVSSFKRGNPPNLGYSPIMNEIYYNSDKLSLLSNAAIETNYRDIDIFHFLYTNTAGEDSIFLNNVVAHLKAGSDPSDEQERASETYKLMNYLNDNNLAGNYVLAGDLNLRSGLSSAFQNLVAYSNVDIRFYDPLNKVAEWHNEASYASIHTQSTHLSGGCPAGGGMDDRFDFYLLSQSILAGTEHVEYVPASYKAVGQDGQRFNQSLVNPANNTVPAEVLSALFNMSDHLPIVIDLAIGSQVEGLTDVKPLIGLTVNNPAREFLTVTVSSPGKHSATLFLRNMHGKVVFRKGIQWQKDTSVQVPISHLPAGLYLIQITDSGKHSVNKKVIITP